MSCLQDKRCHNAASELSAEITEVTNYLQQRGDIKQAILFGSLATGRERPDSDIDLAIEKNHRLSVDEKVEQRCPPDLDQLLNDLDVQDVLTLNLSRAVQICVDISLHILSISNQQPAHTANHGRGFYRVGR